MLSVKTLRAALDAIEGVWTEEDTDILGAFEDQAVMQTNDKGAEHCRIVYTGELGFILISDDAPRLPPIPTHLIGGK